MKKSNKLCLSHRREILGAVLILIASWLTIVTLNTGGILGMFLVGGMLCCKRHSCCCSMSCKTEESPCCDESMSEEKMTPKKSLKKPKKEGE